MAKGESPFDSFFKQYITPQWFVLFIALIYVSGFLCESTFFDNYGVREAGETFLRARCIYAGILFLFFPFSVLIPILLKISLKQTESKQKREEEQNQRNKFPIKLISVKNGRQSELFTFPYSAMALLLNTNLLFYLSIFTPRNFTFGIGEWMIPLAILISIVGPAIGDFIIKEWVPSRWSIDQYFASSLLRWAILILVFVYFDLSMYMQFHRQLRIIFFGHHLFPPRGGIYYVIFMLMIPYILKRGEMELDQIGAPEGKSAMKLMCVLLSLMFYFSGIITFALRVYPYIPAARGGGNFLESPRVSVRLTHGFPSGNETNNFANNYFTNSFVIIEQTDSSLFLANATDQGGPSAWMEMGKLPSSIKEQFDTAFSDGFLESLTA